MAFSKYAQLFDTIETYSEQSIFGYVFSKFAQQNDKAGQLDLLSKQIRDPGLASELKLLEALYLKAIEIGGGYNYIKQAINNIINVYLDEESPQQEKIEDTLNEIVIDLRQRAGGGAALSKPDNPEAIKTLREIKNNFNEESLDQEVSDLSKYDERAVSTFDPTGGVSFENAQKGSGSGVSFTGKKALKDWANSYRNEMQRYIDLSGSTRSPATKLKIEKMTETLKKLVEGSLKESIWSEEYQNNNDPKILEELNQTREDNKKLKLERTKLRMSIKMAETDDDIKRLEQELSRASNETDRIRIQEEIEFLKLSVSRDRNKSEERNWRRTLLKSMSGGNFPGQETYAKFKEKIQEAAAKKKSYDEVQKEIAQQLKSHKEAGTLKGLVIFYGQNINTQRRELKRQIYPQIKSRVFDKLKSEEETTFKPFIEALNAAQENPAQVEQIKKEFAAALSKRADNDPRVVAYNQKAAELQKFESNLNELLKRESPDKQLFDILSEDATALISQINEHKIFRPIVKNLEKIKELLSKGNLDG